MSIFGKFSVKNFGTNLLMILVFAFSTAIVANAFQTESPKPTENTSTSNQKDHIEVSAKILSIDAIKGDVTARLEFSPDGKFAKEDGTLTRTIKLDINSSNGKQEIIFDKGKRMPPTEALLNMYSITDSGSVYDYPFDKHQADLTFFFTVKPDKPADKPKTENKDEATKSTEEKVDHETKPAVTEEEDFVEVPITLHFAPQLAGFKIESAKTKESDDTYVDIEMKISRSSTVVVFSTLLMIVMWAMALAVLFMCITVVSGRKVELAMFSFIAALIFAFATIRNNQPGVPPIGTTSDFLSFFWAEIILALSLLIILIMWLVRPAAK